MVFAVFPDGVKVYVDDTDASKAARRSGFVVTGRSATKDGAAADYFAVNAEGTQVYVDDADSKAARRSGFVVTGRSATKDGEAADYLAQLSETECLIAMTIYNLYTLAKAARWPQLKKTRSEVVRTFE